MGQVTNLYLQKVAIILKLYPRKVAVMLKIEMYVEYKDSEILQPLVAEIS